YYAKQESKLNPFVGFSAFNLLMPNESFLGKKSKLPMRFYLHAGVRINISELFYLLPKVLIMHQKKFNQQTVALDAGFYLKDAHLYLLGGVVYRTKDAFALSVGAKTNNITARIA